MEGRRSKSSSGKIVVWSERLEGSVVVEMIEIVTVVDVLTRADKELIEGCRSCEG